MLRQLPRISSTKAAVSALALSAGIGAVAWIVFTNTPKPADEQQAAVVAGSVSWNSLSEEQKTALRPLTELWPTLDADHQRKWIALAHNFNRMSPEERSTLQGRMTDWVELTPAQRTQARLNFGEARKLPTDEKKAKWEEYQSLTPEQRQRLAADRPKPPAGTAPALRPVPPEKILRAPLPLAPTPTTDSAPASSRLNRNTLLPRSPAPATAPAPAPAAVRTAPAASQPAPVATATAPGSQAPADMAAPPSAVASAPHLPTPAASSPVPVESHPLPAASSPALAQ